MRRQVLAIVVLLSLMTLTGSATPGDYGPGYGWGPGYGYGPGGEEPSISPEERQARAKAYIEEYLGHYLPGYRLEKKPGGEEPSISPEERQARAKVYIEEYLRRYLPAYRLEKKPSAEKK